MAVLDVRCFIRAAPEDIWPVIADLAGQADWMVDVRSLRITSDVQQGEGAVLEVRSELFGLPLVHDVMEVTSWQPPLEYGVVHRGQFSGSGVFRLEPVPGGTVFVWREDFKPPLGPVGELGFRWLVEPHLRRVFGRSMDNVRRLAESRTSEAGRQAAG
jgi:hypothetical protein